MNSDKNASDPNQENTSTNTNEKVLPVHNPLKEGDFKQVTQEDVENEQKFKEALTERD